VAVNFIDGGNWSTQRNHQPAISHWQTLSRFKLTILVVIGTDFTDSCKSNYHTIMTMTAPCEKGRMNTQLILHMLHIKFSKHYSYTYLGAVMYTSLKFRYQMMNLGLNQMSCKYLFSVCNLISIYFIRTRSIIKFVTWTHSFPLIFLWFNLYTSECKQQLRTMK
jgi:hypothetical protein